MLGMETQSVAVSGRTAIDVRLQSDSQMIDDVVVVGYGVARKATLTGSVVNVSGEDVAKSPAANISNSLAGKLPGLVVSQRTGQPGADDPDIYIRGTASFNTGNNNRANRPLVIIDGVERDNMGRLNPEDIESFSVLKDASAAIYGSRAANGVIMITTKRGSVGKPQFSFSHNSSLSQPTVRPKMLDAAEWATAFNEGAWYDGGRKESFVPPYSDEVIQKYRDGSDPILYPNTDWIGTLMRDWGYESRTSLSVTGGSTSVRYMLSYQYRDQGSPYRNNPTKYNQHNVRANIQIDLNDYINIGANISSIINDRYMTADPGYTEFHNKIGSNPTLAARYPNGLIAPGRLGENPLLLDQRGAVRNQSTPVYSTFTASVKIPWVEGLRADGSFNYDMNNSFTKDWRLPYYYHEYNVNTGEYDRKQGTGQSAASLRDSYSRSFSMTYNLRLVYDRTFGSHTVGALLGMEQQKGRSSNVFAERRNYMNTQLPDINFGSSNTTDWGTGGGSGISARDNYFGRFNYNYKSKYLAELVFRYDGSANFPVGKRYGFFPSASLGWRISEEQFMRDAAPWVNELKLRASAGQVGNDRVDDFQYMQTYSYAGNYVFGTTNTQGVRAGTMPNPNITWEVSTKYDVGIEASMWNDLLSVDLTWFKEDRSNILAMRNLSIPGTLGFASLPSENIGKTTNQGFEVVLSHRNRVNEDFSYTVSANMSYAKNKIIFMDETPGTYEWRDRTGRPIGAELFYKADGLFNTQKELDDYPHRSNSQLGDIKVIDLNGDGQINSDDQYRFDYSSTPRAVFALNSSFQYKNWDLSLSFQGQSGAYNYDGTFPVLGIADQTNAFVARAKDRWTVDNPNGTMPRARSWQPGNTTFFLYDSSFIRLKTAELGYSLPESLISKIGLSNLRIYASGFNLLTWAKEIKWSDPEISGGTYYYPQQRTLSIGVNVKF
jgi:TonB-linked SusC/RagA family outer membrane protein